MQLKERSHHSVAECEQLTVQQKVVGDGQGCLDHLREGRGDLVEVARVEHHAVAFLVQLATDPVVFVFHPGFPANPVHDGGRVLFRGGQHELERVHQPQPRLSERAPARQQGDLAQVTAQHRGPGHIAERDVEASRDPFLHEPCPQADPQVTGQDLAYVFRLQGRQPDKQVAQDLSLFLDCPFLVDPVESLLDVEEAGRFRSRLAGQNLLDHVAHVGVAEVGLAEGFFVHLGHLADGVSDHGISQVQLSLVAVGERPRCEIDRRQGKGQVIPPGQVFAQQPGFFQLAAGRTDRLGNPGELFR